MGRESLGYDYDGSLLTSETVSGTMTGILSYTYNNDFAVSSFTYAGTVPVNYVYDDDGLLTSAGRFTIDRNVQNGLPEKVYDGTFMLDRRPISGYGETDREIYSVGGNTVYSQQVDSRDSAGRITSKTEPTGVYVYSYDSSDCYERRHACRRISL